MKHSSRSASFRDIIFLVPFYNFKLSIITTYDLHRVPSFFTLELALLLHLLVWIIVQIFSLSLINGIRFQALQCVAAADLQLWVPFYQMEIKPIAFISNHSYINQFYLNLHCVLTSFEKFLSPRLHIIRYYLSHFGLSMNV